MPFRLVVTADLHHDVPRSRASAEAMVEQVNDEDADAVLVIGDAASGDGEALARCLSLFRRDRANLFVPGNHELWTRGKGEGSTADYRLRWDLPRRMTEDLGWRWLPGSPAVFADAGVAVVGSLGWYDYAFAEPSLGLPRRFYAAGMSPAAALRSGEPLEPEADDVPPHARGFYARWNDSRHIRGIGDDAIFLGRRLAELRDDLTGVAHVEKVVCAVHCVPLAELLPPVPPGPVPDDRLKYAFARAYLGSPEIGRTVFEFPNVTHLLCGHSHHPRRATINGVECVNVGGGYEEKQVEIVELE